MLWTPLFFSFRRALEPRVEKTETGAALIWAFALGTAFAAVHFFVENFVRAAGFGLSRWLYALFDVVLPAIFPFAAALLLRLFRPRCFTPSAGAFRAFAFIALIPEGVFRSLLWGASSNPLLLLFVPLLWTAVAEGMAFFAGTFRQNGGGKKNAGRDAAAVFGLALLPAAAPFSFWAFFGRRTVLGTAVFMVTAAPALVSVAHAWRENRRAVSGGEENGAASNGGGVLP